MNNRQDHHKKILTEKKKTRPKENLTKTGGKKKGMGIKLTSRQENQKQERKGDGYQTRTGVTKKKKGS